ncbi:MAG: tRNA dimethylallyltransferase [Betaproteobacteria bacterium]|nr:tRNA (adenosine(37)-N6)-dimethylallyltransferase MiaA [Rhodocyclaceae bacterium]
MQHALATPTVCLLGPTASGKTAVALALAQRLPVEVVSVDSAQVFRDMDVGTAKPAMSERAMCRHHLLDLISPEERYSAARFVADARRAIATIRARGNIPLLVGGTMLYFKALRDGLSDLPSADASVRAEILERARSLGWPTLHAELARQDPDTARRLAPNDAQRIQRALEILHVTGAPLAAAYARRPDSTGERFELITLGVSDRSTLHRRIEQRFDAMIANGLLDEVAGLKARYRLDAELPSMRCVGYRQAWAHLDGETDFDAFRQRAVAATRQLAKRQLTWLRALPADARFDCLDPDLTERVSERVQRIEDRSAPTRDA